MKKIFIYLFSATVLVLSSCAKEFQGNIDDNTTVEPAKEMGITIKAYVAEGDITKTSYADETTFSWVGNECLSMQLIKVSDGTTRDRWVFYNNTESGGLTANFKSSGSLNPETWGLGEYAFYPFPGNSNCPDRSKTWNVGTWSAVNSGTAEQRARNVIVSNSFTSAVANPLQIVPMIGFKDAEDNFAFHTATGILKITVKDIDARLAKVQLYSAGQKLNGTYTMTGDGNDAYIAMTTTSTASEEILDAKYSDWSSETELPFYFPLPVGTLNSGFQIRLLDSSDNVIRKVTAPGNVTIERNKISEVTAKIGLPAEDFSVSITAGGTSAAPTATIALADATSAKVVIAASVSAGESLIEADDASVVTFANDETKSLPLTNISYSGSAYIVAKSYAESVEKLSNSVGIYVLSSEAVASLCKKHTSTGYKSNNQNSTLSGSYTFEVSESPLTSNIKMTEFDGMTPDISSLESTHNIYTSLYWIAPGTTKYTGEDPKFGAGTAQYGIYDSSTGSISLDATKPFFTRGLVNVYVYSYSDFAGSGHGAANTPGTFNFSVSEGVVNVADTYINARFDGNDKASAPYSNTVTEVVD